MIPAPVAAVPDDALHHLRLLRDDCVTPIGVVGAVVLNGYRLEKVREALDAVLAAKAKEGGA